MYNNSKTTKIVLTTLLFVLIPAISFAASKHGAVKKGNLKFVEGDFVSSEDYYSQALQKEPESDIINFNIGTALYKQGEYDNALNYLQKALLTEDEELKQRTHYNLGNSFYKSGVDQKQKDPQMTKSSFEQALSQYEQALAMNKEDEDAKHNYELVKKKLEELEQQQQQDDQKQDQSRDQEKSDENKEQNKQDQQNQDNQDKQQSQGEQEQQDQQEQGESSENQDSESQSTEEEKSEEEQQSESESEQGEQEKDKQQGKDKEEQGKQQQQGQAQQINANDLTQKEAQMLLENYKQSEEPKGLLNVFKQPASGQPVLKDW